MSEEQKSDRSMRGSFPGGPSQEGQDLAVRTIRTGEDTERSRDRVRLRREARRRKRVLAVVAVAGVLAAVAGGLVIGSSGGPDTVAARAEAPQSRIEQILTAERSRILAELWRMEAMEVAR